jgi:hypothetical protein
MFSCCFRKRRSSSKNSCTYKCRARHRTNSIKNVAQCCDVSEFDVVELCKSLCDTRPSANASACSKVEVRTDRPLINGALEMHVENRPYWRHNRQAPPPLATLMVRSAPTCAALFDASICDRGASSPVLPSLGNFLSCTCRSSRPLLQPSLLTLAAKIFVDLPVHTSCTRRPLQLKTPLTPDASIDTRFQQAINTILHR